MHWLLSNSWMGQKMPCRMAHMQVLVNICCQCSKWFWIEGPIIRQCIRYQHYAKECNALYVMSSVCPILSSTVFWKLQILSNSLCDYKNLFAKLPDYPHVLDRLYVFLVCAFFTVHSVCFIIKFLILEILFHTPWPSYTFISLPQMLSPNYNTVIALSLSGLSPYN